MDVVLPLLTSEIVPDVTRFQAELDKLRGSSFLRGQCADRNQASQITDECIQGEILYYGGE